MKILIVHYRYYEWGGPERYLFNVTERLEAAGHQVIPFSVQHPDNRQHQYAQFFAPAIGSSGAKRFNDQALTPGVIWRKLERTFYSGSVEERLGALIDEVQPDVMYALQYLRHLSPSVLVAAKRRGIPVVSRISDYELVCPEAHLLRNGRICEECIEQRSLWPSVRHGCVKNSRVQSLVNVLASGYHGMRGYLDLIDRIVTPSRIVMQKLVEGGFAPERLTLLPTFVDVEKFRTGPTPPSGRNTILYLGQLRPEKGVDVLIRAWSGLRGEAAQARVRLVIVGSGPTAYETQLRELAAGNTTIEFTGAMPVKAVPQLFHNARASVVPSVWYENLPNSLLESYASGTPVIASSVGSLAEVVTDGETGWTFPAGSEEGLAACLRHALVSTSGLDAMGVRARTRAVQEYNPSLHLQRLLTVFDRVDDRPLGVAAVAS